MYASKNFILSLEGGPRTFTCVSCKSSPNGNSCSQGPPWLHVCKV